MSVNVLRRAAGCLDPGFSAGLGPVRWDRDHVNSQAGMLKAHQTSSFMLPRSPWQAVAVGSGAAPFVLYAGLSRIQCTLLPTAIPVL